MRTWAAALSVMGVVLLGCGCASEESTVDQENAQAEAVTGSAPGALLPRCREVCRQECYFDSFHRRICRRTCRRVCDPLY